MSQAEALLNSLTETVIDHTHVVPDSDAHFTIDPYTREIVNVNYTKTVLMRGDHNSERFTFELPRFVDGHDMALCNRVMVHFDNVGATIEEVHSDVAYMNDLRVNPAKPDTVISSWLIRREATQIVGILSFSLQYQCVEEGEITYEWNTDSYDEIEIRKSKQNGEAAVINYTNVLEEWRSQIFGAGDSVMANITSEGATQVAAVQTESATQQAAIGLKGSETLATIPEDYTEVYNMASEAVRTKGDGVICEDEGEVITLDDASDDYIRGLKIYGKSTQFTTTGKNKLNLGDQVERVVNGVTLTPNYDSNGNLLYLNVNGTSTSTFILLSVPFSIKAGSYTFTNFVSRTVEDGTLHAQICDSNSGLMYPQDMGLGGDFTFEEDTDLIYRIYIGEGRVASNEKLYPMLRDASVVDATYEPFTGGMPSPNPEYPQEIESIENPTVTICGKNLWDHMHDRADMSSIDGWGNTLWGNSSTMKMLKSNTTYTMSFDVTCLSLPEYTSVFSDSYGFALYPTNDPTKHTIMVMKSDEGVFKVGETRHAEGTFTTPSGIEDPANGFLILRYTQRFLTEDGTAVYATVKFDNVQIEIGPKATEYIEYCGSDMQTNCTLYGVPVTLGGNYTDKSGQQWICDEVDFERGVYIQRINKVELTGTEYINQSAEKWQRDGMYSGYAAPLSSSSLYGVDIPEAMAQCFSTHAIPNGWEWNFHNYLDNVGFRKNIVHLSLNNRVTGIAADDSDTVKLTKYKAYLAAQYDAGTPVTVWYPLATPIETPLTADEIETYKFIRTNYPNTTVLNDVTAMMKVKYNADTKLYIENAAVYGVASVVEEVLNETY